MCNYQLATDRNVCYPASSQLYLFPMMHRTQRLSVNFPTCRYPNSIASILRASGVFIVSLLKEERGGEMVRGKTQMKRIENATSRQVTFSKRRSGLLKKAFELSVLCDAEVALIIFSTKGKLYEFSSSSINETVERYHRNAKELGIGKPTVHEDMQHLKKEAVTMEKKIELLDETKRKLLGDGLESCSIDELQEIEDQLNRGLSSIRAKKSQLYKEKIEQLKEEVRVLYEENAKLRKKCELQSGHLLQQEVSQRQILDVETELFIGPPERRISR
ncbi:hypothetical protein F0562_012725 [Nyssa sinensis]|uniref:Uncharacterized protein n=1 Tax=Nyssa sinensis TaxID=561372 RepID=A0A5J4ZY38_9ASTE|nr:hypothetical protein F0562_012725 [Nyssa sinensis]